MVAPGRRAPPRGRRAAAAGTRGRAGAGVLRRRLTPGGVRPGTHRPRWVREVGSYGGRVHVVGDTVFLVSGNGGVSAVDAATNKQRWRHPVTGQSQPVFFGYGDGRTGYALETSADGTYTDVTAVDPVRGTTLWHHRLDGTLDQAGAGPGQVLYFVERNRDTEAVGVVRYDPASGDEHRVPLTTRLSSPTYTASGDTVYLLGSDGGLVAVDSRRTTARAAQRWRQDTSVSNASWPVVGDGLLCFSAADGRLLGWTPRTATCSADPGPHPQGGPGLAGGDARAGDRRREGVRGRAGRHDPRGGG
ncbi:PQQ-binding-like beta-propeller repeat protein [Streptomyces sp. M19]